MSLSFPLFTNEVGSHFTVKNGYLHDRGRFGDNPPFDNVRGYTYHNEISIKPTPQPGDGHSAYNYTRSGGKVLTDIPSISRHYDGGLREDGTHNNWDYTREDSITQDYIPFSYRPDSEYISESHAKSVTQALNGLVNNSTQLGADLGESHKTFEMLSKSVGRLAQVIRALQKKDFRTVVNILGLSKAGFNRGRSLASDWLEYQYGWKPLMSSIYDTAHLLSHQVQKDNFITSNGTGSFSDAFHFRLGAHEWDVKLEGGHKTRLIAQCVVQGLYTANSLGITNPMSIAWELVPFSFMVDWFVPVGQFMSAMTAPLGLQFIGGYTSFQELYSLAGGRVMDDEWPYGYERLTPGRYEEKSFAFERTAYATFPLPELYASTNPYRSTRALNAIAIMRSL